MNYSMNAIIEAERLEEQIHHSNYQLSSELDGLPFFNGAKFFDAGCGTGVVSKYLSKQYPASTFDAVDCSDLRIGQAKKIASDHNFNRIYFQTEDLNNIHSKFHGNYDFAISRFVIEHVSDPLAVLAEIKKTLRPGGKLIIIELDGVFFNLYSDNQQLNDYLETIKKNVGFDLFIGRKVPNMFKKIGLSNINWRSMLMECRGDNLIHEYHNTKQRLIAAAPLLGSILQSTQKYDHFVQLYLKEMMKKENTLVFTKYICEGQNL